MDVISYIYEFLHDPRKNRWPQPVVDYLLTLAEADITSKVNTFLKAREIQRELAQLKQLGTTDKTVPIHLVDGVSVYSLPEDFLRVSSVLYENCFVPHMIPDCDITPDCDECGEVDPMGVIRSYNTSGLPSGKIMFSPPPSEVVECEWDITEITRTKVEVLNEESTLGWGFLNVLPKQRITEVEEKCTTVHTDTKRTHLEFGDLQVTYEASNVLEFDDNDADVLATLLADDQLKKFFVCGHLLRDDKDSNSRSLGAEELQLFEQRIVTLLGKYAELYDKDNVLAIASANEGYVDTRMNEDVLKRDLLLAELNKVEEAKQVSMDAVEEAKRMSIARTRKSKFDVLGVR